MTAEQQARAYWYNRMMNVTARGFRPQAAAGAAVNPWKWTPVRDCPPEFIEALNSDHAPFLEWLASSAAPSPWKGFYRMDRVTVGDMFYDLQLEYGMGDEQAIMLTFDGFPIGSKSPTLIPVAVAAKKA